jgi:hypothetical protein
VLAWAGGRKNCFVHIRKDWMVAMKENTAVFVLQTELQTVYEFPLLEI